MGLSQRRERLLRRLRVPKTRARERAVLVEGVRAVSEALDAEVEVSFAVASPMLRASAAGAALAERLSELDLVEVADRELARTSVTSGPQGVVLVCAEPTIGLDVIASGGRHLVLDGVQDPGNCGTLIRAAAAFALDAVACLEGTVDPWAPKSVRASAGAIFRISVVRAAAAEVLARLGAEGVPLLVGDAEGDDVDGCPGAGAFALALGNEGGGVRESVATAAERRVAVRMPGPTDSLNVAMAGSILLHALTRKAGR